MLNLDSEAQVYDSTFTFCYGHLKKVILLVKVATVPSVLLLAVHPSSKQMIMTSNEFMS